MSKIKIYYCDVSKNVECPKNCCYIHNRPGKCYLTKDIKCRAKGIKKLIMIIKFGRDKRMFDKIKRENGVR